jgi:hypothetical protein
MPRSTSGPVVNYDDPDAYWDQLEGGRGPHTTPAMEYRPVKYVEAAAPAVVLGDIADQNADVRSLAEDYRDPAIATPQDKVTGAEPQGCLGVETAARVVAVAGGDTGFNAWFNARQATCGMIAWQCCSHACLVAAVVLHPCACSE